MRKCNVIFPDKHFHEMHHALGNPWPEEVMGETFRNYFATEPESDTAKRMLASPHWGGGRARFGMAYFHVSAEGRRALLEYMLENVEVPQRYTISFRRHRGEITVIAKSRSAAKYAAYLDADLDWPFIEYVAEIASVRLHSRATTPTHP